MPPLTGGQWDVNGAVVKLAGALSGQVSMGGNTVKAGAIGTKGAWTVNLAIESAGPVNMSGTLTGPGPTIDATIVVFGSPVSVQGVPGKDLTVNFGRRPTQTTEFVEDARLAAAVESPRLASDSPDQLAATIGSEWLGGFIAFTIVGWLLILVAPGLRRRADVAIRSLPFSRLGLGVILLLDIPIASIVMIAIGLPLGLWWLGIVGLFCFAVLALAGYSFAGLQVGRLILAAGDLTRLGSFVAVPLGVAVIVLIGLLPYVGTLASLLIAAYGLGSMLYAPRQPALVAAKQDELAVREERGAPAGRPVVE